MACSSVPRRIACQNYGSDGQITWWKCESTSDAPFTFSRFTVRCERVDGEIVEGSCGLEFVPEYNVSNIVYIFGMIGLFALAICMCLTGNGDVLMFWLLSRRKKNGGFGSEV